MPLLIKLPDSSSLSPSRLAERSPRRGRLSAWVDRLAASRLGGWGRAVARVWSRAADVMPLSWMGTAVVALSVFALWRWGYGQMDLLLFVFGLSGLALTILAVTTTSASAIYLRRYLAGHPELGRGPGRRIETEVPTETGFHLPSLSFVPLVKIAWQMEKPVGIECRRRRRETLFVEELVARRRCRVAAASRRIVVRDAFGLTRVAFRRPLGSPLVVLPQVGRLGAMPPLFSLASAEGLPHPTGAPEGDRMEIRRYVPGDPVRHILWKVYARNRQLTVRVPERSVDRSPRMVAFLAAGGADEAAAAAARVALEKGYLGSEWMFGADDAPTPTDDLETALLAVADSGNSPAARPGRDLAAFLSHPDTQGGQGSIAGASAGHCVIFAQAGGGVWVEQVLATLAAHGGSASFVLGTDGVLDADRRPWWERFLFRKDDARPSTTLRDLNTLTARLAGAGHDVRVVDRRTGRSHEGGRL